MIVYLFTGPGPDKRSEEPGPSLYNLPATLWAARRSPLEGPAIALARPLVRHARTGQRQDWRKSNACDGERNLAMTKPSMGDGPSFGAAQSFEAHCVRTSG